MLARQYLLHGIIADVRRVSLRLHGNTLAGAVLEYDVCPKITCLSHMHYVVVQITEHGTEHLFKLRAAHGVEVISPQWGIFSPLCSFTPTRYWLDCRK